MVIPAVQSMLSSNDTDGAKGSCSRERIATNTKEDQKQNLLNAMSGPGRGRRGSGRVLRRSTLPLKPVEKASAKLAIYSAGGARNAARSAEITADSW